MNPALPDLQSEGQIQAQVNGCLGLLTLNRPQALNALSLAMVRDLATLLQHWAVNPQVQAVVLSGAARPGKAAAFCAGGDIRYFHQAVLAGDPSVDDFFTEEYALNLLIHQYPKPVIALMDGVVMGGGMGISQGARLRVLTEQSRLAMPETNIGLFPDVGGGHFLAACPGHVGEWLALTGDPILAGDAIAYGLGDVCIHSADVQSLLRRLHEDPQPDADHVLSTVRACVAPTPPAASAHLRERIDRHFGGPDLAAILASLASAADAAVDADGETDDWARHTHATLLKRSPLMMAVTLEQVRRGRHLSLADDLRMERDLVHHCFHDRPGAASETMEGIRALAIDKDHRPSWNPASVAEVTPAMVQAYFVSPWLADRHPLRDLR